VTEPAASTPTAPDRLPPIGVLFSESFQLYKSRALTFFGILLIGAVVAVAAAGFCAALGFALTRVLPAGKPVIPLIASSAAVLAVVYVICRFQLALVGAALAEKPGIGEALRSSSKSVPSFLWLGILTAFLVFGGFLFFVIPGILFTVWFWFAPFVFVAEGTRGSRALFRSKALVAGRWWGVALRLLSVTALSILIAAIPFIGPFLDLLFIPFGTLFACALYRQLAAGRPAPAEPPRKSFLVFVIGILGYLVLPGLMIFLAFAVFPGVLKSLKHLSLRPVLSAIPAPAAGGLYLPAPASRSGNVPSGGVAGAGGARPSQEPVTVSTPEPDLPSPTARSKGSVSIILKNGHRLYGRIVEEDPQGLWLEAGDGARVYLAREEIEKTQ